VKSGHHQKPSLNLEGSKNSRQSLLISNELFGVAGDFIALNFIQLIDGRWFYSRITLVTKTIKRVTFESKITLITGRHLLVGAWFTVPFLQQSGHMLLPFVSIPEFDWLMHESPNISP
jgi:hypothetical protein